MAGAVAGSHQTVAHMPMPGVSKPAPMMTEAPFIAALRVMNQGFIAAVQFCRTNFAVVEFFLTLFDQAHGEFLLVDWTRKDCQMIKRVEVNSRSFFL